MARSDTYEEEEEISTQAGSVWTDTGTVREVFSYYRGKLTQNIKIIEFQACSQHTESLWRAGSWWMKPLLNETVDDEFLRLKERAMLHDKNYNQKNRNRDQITYKYMAMDRS
jgi:hypothetical protein